MDLFRPIQAPGMGGPGQGMTGVPGQPLMSFQQWMDFQRAAGFGLGPYGYPLGYGLSVPGQQNLMLNQQWGWPTVGGHGLPLGSVPPHR